MLTELLMRLQIWSLDTFGFHLSVELVEKLTEVLKVTCATVHVPVLSPCHGV